MRLGHRADDDAAASRQWTRVPGHLIATAVQPSGSIRPEHSHVVIDPIGLKLDNAHLILFILPFSGSRIAWSKPEHIVELVLTQQEDRLELSHLPVNTVAHRTLRAQLLAVHLPPGARSTGAIRW